MYKLIDTIRIRKCGDLSFLVNIKNNTIFKIKTKTLEFLEYNLQKGLSIHNLSSYEPNFVRFIKDLEEQHILEMDTNDIR